MVYKNFLLRLLFSLIFILIYFICCFINFEFVFYLIFFIYFLIFFEIYIYFQNYKSLPLFYVFLSLIFFLFIDFNQDIFINFNLFILTVITFDIFSYLIGKTYGRNKLIKVSPNKTIEGFFGGYIFSLIFSTSFALIFKLNINLSLILFLNFIIISSFIGDIIESFFKRKNNLKNSSEFIPGHGGVFDRFDSFLFAIIFYSIFVSI